MVRMSDLVRGVAPRPATAPRPVPAERPADPPAPPTPPQAPPSERPAEPAVRPTERVSVASAPTPPPPPARHEPADAGAPAERADALFGELHAFGTEVRGVLQAGSPFPWGRLQALVDRVVTALTHSADLFWVANTPPAAADVDPVGLHQARVCVLALRIGAGLGYDRGRLASLGQAAALFDVALWQLPEAARRGDVSVGDDLTQWRAHPRLSAEIIGRWKPADAHIVQTVLEHHEREQGQGFPQGLHGAAIAPDAKIVGLVDAYATLTAPPPARSRLKPHEAIREIVKTRNDQFPAALVKALLSEISVFPPGTMVRLNTEEVGRVIAVNRQHPLRPKVEIVADGKTKRLPAPKVVDLSEAPFLYITGPVGESGR